MFGCLNSLINMVFALVIGIPIIGVLTYFIACLLRSLFGGPIWLWVTLVIIFFIGGLIEEWNKMKSEPPNN